MKSKNHWIPPTISKVSNPYFEHTFKWSYHPKYTSNSNSTQIFVKTIIVYLKSKDRILSVLGSYLGSYTFSHDRTCIYHMWPNLLFGNNFWNHHNFVHTQSITEYKLFGNKITDYHHHRSYYYRLVVLLFSTNTESIITNINYCDLFVSRTVLLPIRYITNKSYYRIDYHRFVLLLNISIPE